MNVTAEAPVLDRYRLNYPGNLVGRIEGQVIGPNIFGEWFAIAVTEYDFQADRTVARVRFATREDVMRAWGATPEPFSS